MADTEQLTVRKLGNSIGFTLPASLARQLHLTVGQQLDVRTEKGNLIVAIPERPRYSRAQLLAQCDPKAPAPVDMSIWDSIAPVGAEVV